MKRLFQKLTAILCTGMICLSCNAIPAHAEEDDSTAEIVLPSGKPVKWFQHEMEETAKLNTEDERFFASAVVGLFQGDDVIYTGYFGETDIENHIPADENSVYEWGSISKTFVWVSAMQLWEQGKLDLEKDVREYLPDGFFQHLSYDEPITMMNLMNHNAGWQETIRPIMEADENKILPLGEMLQAIEPAQIHRPNEVTAYSNYGAAVAGYVIECVSGMDYCEYVHKNILEPLGMEHTAINPTHSDNEWVCEQRKKMKSYEISHLTDSAISRDTCLLYVSPYPAGAVTGTLSDLMTYAQAFVNDDAPLFQHKETQELLFSGTYFYGDSDIPECCHGFWCEEYAVRVYGHNGATYFGEANMIFDPISKIGLVVLINEPNSNWYMEYTPFLAFGNLDPNQYAVSGEPQKATFKDYYLISRSTYRGMLKFVPYLSGITLNGLGEIEDIGNHLYQIRSEESSMILGEKANSNLEISSMELIPDKFYLVKLCLFTVYVLLAVISAYLIRIRHKLIKANRWSGFKGATVLTVGRITRIVSVLLLLSTYVVLANFRGLPYNAGKIIGILQMGCIGVCGISALLSIVDMLSKQEGKAYSYRYLLNTVGNALCVTAILYFEMYRFWGC